MTPETPQTLSIFPLRRPVTLAACARFGARRYRRDRDLPGAVPGLLAGDAAAILPRLVSEERRCEEARRARSAEYRPAQHVQILSALLAEAADVQASDGARATTPMPPFSPGDTPISAPVRRPEAPGRVARALPQAKASGSEALRLAM